MSSVPKLVGWAMLGFVTAWVLAFAGFLIVYGPGMLWAQGDDSWSLFSALMGSTGIAWGGLLIGMVHGIVRFRRSRVAAGPAGSGSGRD